LFETEIKYRPADVGGTRMKGAFFAEPEELIEK
jgi:hypothetical protein